ncbi:tRNA uridine-5-carboxymethylaminomethyl(34) synthesis GTPase MnmE [Sphingomonas sinipercae]|uniref:tRNA modification GTPase MnmE n=1 Tax=Sphingomonas sinipercae TaxID=2714944 RepID=A0A6G7ZKW3_9SPHN|nr:tRNA uridine-5-carboxymethylaminomethyl(34) synthesis GTPase MnmE [Sphingomonas sinipercae]QIL01558.1 tRNA uridine-5-carboxymethylaminomethyl(34) synthesis GTPase MnmE [Sphingomonas sinipercae]
MHDTIFALSSGRPPAAIAVIRISGPSAHASAARLAGELPPARHAAVRELRGDDGELLDEALLLRFDGPASATGEDLVELHCHGGRAVVDVVLGALARHDDLREARPGEFTRRAFENGRIDLTAAEGLADLLEAETQSQRRAALLLADGHLSRQIEAWQARLLQLSARAEAAIDYVDEDSVDADPAIAADAQALVGELDAWLARATAEPLRDGVLVVIAGPPNAGKSSLLNVIVGSERAIVSDSPGTTRDHIEVAMALDGVPLRLTDTAGIREAEGVEGIGVARAHRLVDAADILLWLGEVADAPAHPRRLNVHARADLPDRRRAPAGSLAVSSVTGEGISELLVQVTQIARQMLPGEGEVALNRRQRACLAAARDDLALLEGTSDSAVVANCLRSARSAFDRLTGRAGVEDMLDALFGRFCLGK